MDSVQGTSQRIVLIDGTELAVLMVRNSVGVRTRTTYEIKKLDEDYSPSEGIARQPDQPRDRPGSE
jgi:restriction endonuclease Mrr